MDREEMINAEDYDTLLKEVETNSWCGIYPGGLLEKVS